MRKCVWPSCSAYSKTQETCVLCSNSCSLCCRTAMEREIWAFNCPQPTDRGNKNCNTKGILMCLIHDGTWMMLKLAHEMHFRRRYSALKVINRVFCGLRSCPQATGGGNAFWKQPSASYCSISVWAWMLCLVVLVLYFRPEKTRLPRCHEKSIFSHPNRAGNGAAVWGCVGIMCLAVSHVWHICWSIIFCASRDFIHGSMRSGAVIATNHG